ncbi:alpha/beta hydrolase [Bacillus salitolerans]|uniref:Alpha/beta hydrolase n=1 Tax=Bacillus salitolerans TaxID=1437434 RepID=A0ABW4LT33_9BACI
MIGCLCIHGFTGSPYEVEPLVHYLRETTDWKVVAPALPGHGDESNLLGISYKLWIEFVEEELEELVNECETVYVIGFSMGGMLAAYLAARYPINKLILLSASAYYVNMKQLIVDVTEMIRDGVKGNLKDNILYQRYRKKVIATPLAATKQFRLLVRTVRPLLKNIRIPTLIVQGECDGIVPVKSAHYLFEHIGSEEKKLLFLSSSPHHVCHGPDYKQLENAVTHFLQIKEKSSC